MAQTGAGSRTARTLFVAAAVTAAGVLGAQEPPPLDAETLADEASWRHVSEPFAGASSELRLVWTGGDGAPWAAHRTAVYRYDGWEWSQVPFTPVLEPTETFRHGTAWGDGVVVTTADRVWTGGPAGLAPLDLTAPGYRVEPVRAVATSNGEIWVDSVLKPEDGEGRPGALDERAVLRWREGVTTRVDLPATPVPGGVAAIWHTRPDRIWVNTLSGLFSREGDAWRLRLSPVDGDLLDIRHLRENSGSDGALDLHRPVRMRGVWRWRDSGTPEREDGADEGFVSALDVHESGAVLVVLDSQEAMWIDRAADRVNVPRLVAAARSIWFDGPHRLWSTNARSLSSFDPARRLWKRWPAPQRGLEARIHEILVRADGSTWLATADGITVVRADGGIDRIRTVDGLSLGAVTGLAEDSAGNVWISSGSSFHGVYRWDGREWTLFVAPDPRRGGHFHRIRADSGGRLWFLGLRHSWTATRDDPGVGVWVLENGEVREWEHSSGLPSGQTYGFAEHEGTLWFATMNGLGRFSGGEWTHWGRDALRGVRITDVAVGADGVAWFVDAQIGLGSIDDDRVAYLLPDDGLPFADIRQILADSQGLWLAGGSGVARYRDGVFSWVSLDARESMADVWPLTLDGDRLLAGTQGLGVLELDVRATADLATRTRILGVAVADDTTVARWHAVSADELVPSDLIETRYRVDDEPWSAWTTARNASITGLEPGQHTLTVQSKSPLGKLAEPTTAGFVTPRPLLRDPYFYLPLAAVGLALALGGAHTYQRRRAERETLRRSEARYRSLFESASDTIVTRDLAGNITSVNRAGLALTGYSPEEVKELTVEKLLTPESVHAVQRMLLAKMRGREATVYEAEIVHRDGTVIPVEMSSQLIHEDGKIAGAQAFIRDIRDRKRAEESLRNIAMGISAATGDDLFRSLVEYLARELGLDFAFVATPSDDAGLGEAAPRPASQRYRSVAFWGDGAIRDNFEYDLRGTPCDVVVETGLCAFAERVQASFPDDDLLREMGVESYVGAPLHDSSGRRLGIMVVMGRGPLGDGKLARSMLQIFAVRAAAEIEKSRAEDALLRTEEELRQAQKMEAIGRLAGGIAHDFNNLLTVINGYTELALDTVPAESDLQDDLRQIALAGENARHLTNQLLAFTRRQALDPTIIEPFSVTRSMRPLLERLLKADDRLEIELPEAAGAVLLGSGQLEQILMNLVSNAVDATGEGGTITIRGFVRTTVGSSHQVVLEVEDDGSGMDEATRLRVFEPFFTTKAVGVGTGLGLSTVYGIVRQSGGELDLQSTPGVGTTVRIVWPLVEGFDEAARGDETAGVVATGAGTVLLVDDQDMVRSFVERALNRIGFRVVATSSGTEALEFLAANGQVDLVISDVVMPGMDGVELAQRVRANDTSTPILLMSGYTDRQIPVELGTAPLLQKPFTPAELGERVRQLLEPGAGA